MENVKFIAKVDEAAWVVDLGKDGVFVCDAVLIGIDEADDAAFTWAFAEGTEKIHADIDFASRCSGNTRGRWCEIAACVFCVGQIGGICGSANAKGCQEARNVLSHGI